MLLKHLYRISLEEPHHCCFFMGIGVETDDMREGLRIERLHAYIHGFRDAQRELSAKDEEAEAFFDWLIRVGEFPSQGWVRKYLADEGGDEARAIRKFFHMLHRYLLEQQPACTLMLHSSRGLSDLAGATPGPWSASRKWLSSKGMSEEEPPSRVARRVRLRWLDGGTEQRGGWRTWNGWVSSRM